MRYLTAAALALVSLVPAPVGAEESGGEQRARELFMRGAELFGEDDYEGALEAFEASYELNPVTSVLYNAAMCQRALFRYVESLQTFEHYLEAGGERISAERRAEVEELLEEMEARVGHIRLDVSPADATVELDGVGVDPDRWSGLRARTGRHTLRFSAPGHLEQVRQLDLPARGITEVEVELVPEPEAPPIEITPDPSPPPPTRPSVVRQWWFWTIIGAVVVGGVATGLGVGLTREQVGAGDWEVRLP